MGAFRNRNFNSCQLLLESLGPRFMAHRSPVSKRELQVGVRLWVHPETEISISVTYCWRAWTCDFNMQLMLIISNENQACSLPNL